MFRRFAPLLHMFALAASLGVGVLLDTNSALAQTVDPIWRNKNEDCDLFSNCTAREAARIVADETERRYHVDPYTMRNYGEGFNVSLQKDFGPQVSLVFTPNDPKPGEEVTAHAFPIYFSNSTEQLYYTWYLQRRDCAPDKGYSKDCDLDGNGKVNVNDWKIEAMKILAQNNYAPDLIYDKKAEDDKNTDGYKATFGGDAQVSEKQCGPNNENRYCCYIHDFNGGAASGTASVIDYELTTCEHLFPKFGKSSYVTGDGKFPAGEEALWGTNPTDPDTAQNNRKDEANVVGLGAKDFRWIYNTDDKIGVVIEGVGLNTTKHENTSKMIEWAFLRNKCPVKSKSSYTKTIRDYSVVIPTATMDLDDCLKDNLVDPTEGGQPGNMDLSLASDPANPVAHIVKDANEKMKGDILTVQTISNGSANDASTIWYSWNVRMSQDGTFNPRFDDPNQWVDITKELVDKKLITAIEGNGIDKVKVNLNFDSDLGDYFKDGVGYLYFTGTAKENFQQGVGRGARAAQVIRITLSNYQIHPYTVKATDGVDGSKRVALDTEICTDESNQTACRVTPNQVVGLKAPDTTQGSIKYDNYLWTVNGKSITCNTKVSPDCIENTKLTVCDAKTSSNCSDAKQGEVNFFPVLGDIGEQYVVSLTMLNSDTGESLNLTRTFSIVEPGVTIVSADETSVWPRYLGLYEDVNGNTSYDYSKSILETFPDNTVTLKVLYNADNIKDASQLVWILDGVVQNEDGENMETFSFDENRGFDETYAVSVKGVYRQPQDIRKALKDIWGVSPFESEENYFDTRVQVDVVAPENGESTTTVGFLKGPMKYFASFVAYIPDTVLFALRLAFTAAFALFLIGFVRSFLPNPYENSR